jgi:hypothetical protein
MHEYTRLLGNDVYTVADDAEAIAHNSFLVYLQAER